LDGLISFGFVHSLFFLFVLRRVLFVFISGDDLVRLYFTRCPFLLCLPSASDA
jgi:hypothetical protein